LGFELSLAVAAIKEEFLAVKVDAQGTIIAHAVAHPGILVTGQGDGLGDAKETAVIEASRAP
jgi:hypothetical protein